MSQYNSRPTTPINRSDTEPIQDFAIRGNTLPVPYYAIFDWNPVPNAIVQCINRHGDNWYCKWDGNKWNPDEPINPEQNLTKKRKHGEKGGTRRRKSKRRKRKTNRKKYGKK